MGVVHNQGFHTTVAAQAAHHAHEVHHVVGSALDYIVCNALNHKAFVYVFVKGGADNNHRNILRKNCRHDFAIGSVWQVEVAEGQKILRGICLQQLHGLVEAFSAVVCQTQLFLEIVRHKPRCCSAVFNNKNFLHDCFRVRVVWGKRQPHK